MKQWRRCATEAVSKSGPRPTDRGRAPLSRGPKQPTVSLSRFFSPKGGFTEKEITRFVDVDFVNHVALVAELEEGDQSVIVGAR